MKALPYCQNCDVLMVISWSLGADGARIARATCRVCDGIEIFRNSASRPTAAPEGQNPTLTPLGASIAPGAFVGVCL
jgi:hypothetical protein